MLIQICISEKQNSKRAMIIPWLPEKISIEGNGTRFAEYDIMDLGEVKIPSGKNLMAYSWESVFPGIMRAGKDSMQKAIWMPTLYYTNLLKDWKNNGTELRLLIVGTTINVDVYLEDFSYDHAGGFGDVEYKVSFVDAVHIEVPEPSEETKKRSDTQSKTTSYTIKSGDTLWGISQRFLGKGSRWNEIYDLNQTIIEDTAKKRWAAAGVNRDSENGHWIFPGTTIKIPQ